MTTTHAPTRSRMVEQWVRSQLRTAWGLSPTEIRDSSGGQLWLDDARRVELIPDLAVRSQGEWCFVGDVKYKALRSDGARQDDVYQMLAYLTATGLSDGTLIYVDKRPVDKPRCCDRKRTSLNSSHMT